MTKLCDRKKQWWGCSAGKGWLGSLLFSIIIYLSIYEPVRAIRDESCPLFLKWCLRELSNRETEMSCEMHVSPGLNCLAKDGRDKKQGECHSPAACFAVRVSHSSLMDVEGKVLLALNPKPDPGCWGQSGEGRPTSQQLLLP